MYERELTLDELLNEPVIRKVMIADGYSAEDIRLLIRQANARSNEARPKRVRYQAVAWRLVTREVLREQSRLITWRCGSRIPNRHWCHVGCLSCDSRRRLL